MLKGNEFRAILKHNKISYEKFANYSGRLSHQFTADLVKMEVIPFKYQKLLGDLLEIDLTIEKNEKMIVENIPQRYYEKKKLTTKKYVDLFK